jgi:hypothetical protein
MFFQFSGSIALKLLSYAFFYPMAQENVYKQHKPKKTTEHQSELDLYL